MAKKLSVKRQDYAGLLGQVKERIQQSQVRAVLSVNAELIQLYWDVGRLLDERQRQQGWGAAVIPRLARDLNLELPEAQGFSERNIKRMLAFFRAYPTPAPIVPQPVAQLPSRIKVPQAVAQIPSPETLLWSIPWGHHALLLEKVKNVAARSWYMERTVQHGWSRNVLLMMIKSRAHARQGKVVGNFADRLPPAQSDLVFQALKDPYVFDFLTLTEPFHERELEANLLQQLERFLLELGQGFAFVGRQYRITVGQREFLIDLLFYHLRLRCFVVIDLKTGVFEPEHAGKMNFYLSAIDDQVRHSNDAPSIGLILCQDRNRVIAEYALRGVAKPIGVSEYELTRALPRELRSSLPTVAAIEAELRDKPDKATIKKRTISKKGAKR